MYPGYPADECPGHYTDYSDLACSGPEIPYSYTGNWVNYHAFADPIHSEAVVTRVNAAIKGMLFQKEPFQTELNQFSFYLNNELIQAFKAPNTTTYPRSHSNMSCTPSTPYNTVRCERWCIEGHKYASRFPGYLYGAENTFSVDWQISRKDVSTMAFCIDNVDLILFYQYIPSIKMIQAIGPEEDPIAGTQPLYEYKDVVDGATTYSNILYHSGLNADKTFNAQAPKINEPVVVPYSPGGALARKFKLRMIMYGAGVSSDSANIKIYWKWDMGRAAGATSGGGGRNDPPSLLQTGRVFEIEMDAPSAVGTYPLNLTFNFKFPDPAYPGYETDLGTQKITLLLYSILDYSKPFAESLLFNEISKDVIGLALGYTAGANTPQLSMQRIVDGVYADHIYEYSVDHQVLPGIYDACGLGGFRFARYLQVRNGDKRLNCFEISSLIYLLARSIGIEMNIYGIPQSFTTREVLGMGTSTWMQYPFSQHQTDEMSAGIYDGTLHFRDKTTDRRGYSIINMAVANYLSKLTAETISGSLCPNPAVRAITY